MAAKQYDDKHNPPDSKLHKITRRFPWITKIMPLAWRQPDRDESQARNGKADSEKYVHWRQRTEAQKMGFQTQWKKGEFRQWLEQKQKDELRGLHDWVGLTDSEATDFYDQYIKLADKYPEASFDELNSQLNIGLIISNIERSCARLNEPIRGGAVSLMSAEFRVAIDQGPSLFNPEINVIRATAVFETFCNQISKLLARTLLYQGNRFICNPAVITKQLESHPALVEHWEKSHFKLRRVWNST